MTTLIFAIAILAAGLVMAGGVWVTAVLIAVVARSKRPAESAPDSPASERPRP